MSIFPQPGQGFNQSLTDVVTSGVFDNVILRDYNHAAKTFRTNSYQYSPKLKFLFHTYFDLNFPFNDQANIGLLVKEIRLPSYTMQTYQMNQYNRKRIIQTKIKYETVDIQFHDDNSNLITKLWEAYYKYYYNDSNKTGNILSAPRGASPTTPNDYNKRTIYDADISGDDDWGFSGGQTNQEDGTKKPFFRRITIFGFNQHNFVAYTLINPTITNFGHDTYSYAEGGGTMGNKMTIDYETVVYNYGALDGRNPGNIVSGFGDPAHYDTTVSPIAGQGRGTILGQGGLIDAVGGALESGNANDLIGAISNTSAIYNTLNNITNVLNNKNIGNEILNGLYRIAQRNTPSTRNAPFNVPIASASPGPIGLAGSLTVGARNTLPARVGDESTAGSQYAGNNLTGPLNNSGMPQDLPYSTED